MALRSLAGKLGSRLLRWSKASGDTLPPPVADLDIALKPMKFEASYEAQILALRKSRREEALRAMEESNRRIRKNYRDAEIIAVGGVGFMAFFWSCALEAFARGLDRAKLMAVAAEESKAMDADEEGRQWMQRAWRWRQRMGNAVAIGTKEEGKARWMQRGRSRTGDHGSSKY